MKSDLYGAAFQERQDTRARIRVGLWYGDPAVAVSVPDFRAIKSR